VLLVEDDEAVRTVARQMLASFGYTVLVAADGEEAMQLAENHPGPIHLLVSDVVMPHASGQEIAQRITQTRSNCRVLFVSGYTDDAVIRHGVQTGDYAFLRKPFTRAELGFKVRRILGAGSGGGGTSP
jgi:CheY-like chemotaxis protein